MQHNFKQTLQLVDKKPIKVSGYPENEKSFEMEFPIKIQYETNNAPKVPLYIHVVGQKPAIQPANGFTGFHYTVSLKNKRTNEFVFKDIKTTKGVMPLVRMEVSVDPKDEYVLYVSSTPNIKQKHVIWRTWIYLPYFTLYVGAWGGQIVDLHL